MIRIWIAMMLALLLLAGCGGEKDAGYVARKLDIVLPQPAAVTSGDSHGGFHGDGLLHMELTFSQEDALAGALGLAALMTRRTGLCAPSLGCCAVALSLVPLHVYLEVEAGDLSAIQDTAHAFALSAAALVLGTLALNAAAWLRTRYKE